MPDRERVLIVDGHNVIFRYARLKELGEGGPRRFAELLNAAALSSFDRVIVVFDASEVVERVELVGRVEAIHTRKGTKADTRVVQLSREHAERGCAVTVVSADWAIQIGALGQGAVRMTPDELMERIASGRDEEGAGSRRASDAFPSTLYEALSPEEREKLDRLYEELTGRGHGEPDR